MPKRPRLIRGRDYEVVEGNFEFTREYLLSLGVCCENECKHCPYKAQGAMADPAAGLGMSTRKVDAQA